VPIVLLERVEEIILAVRESLVSVVSRRESYVIIWIYIPKGRISCQGSICSFAFSIDSYLIIIITLTVRD
jgi:hypothetical protein